MVLVCLRFKLLAMCRGACGRGRCASEGWGYTSRGGLNDDVKLRQNSGGRINRKAR